MLIFATSLKRNARFCFSKGLPKRPKMHSKTTSYTIAFSTSKKHPPSFDFGPSWLPLGTPKALPRGLQDLSKTILGSILGHLGCKFTFWASLGVPPGSIFSNFWSIFNYFWSCFCSKKCFDSCYWRLFCTSTCCCNCFGFSASQRHNRVPWTALLSFFLNQLLVKLPIAAAVWAKPLWIPNPALCNKCQTLDGLMSMSANMSLLAKC